MSIKPLNSIDGYAVSENGNLVIDANSNVFANNFTVTGDSNLGNVGNLTITGGSEGYFLSTDGSGNLSWVESSSVTSIQNGNSNVSIPTANGNVSIGVTGIPNVVVVTPTGANITGTLNVSQTIGATGTITGGNVVGTTGVYSNSGTISGRTLYASNSLTSDGAIYPRDTLSSSGNDGILFNSSDPGVYDGNASIRFSPGTTPALTITSAWDSNAEIRLNSPDVFVSNRLTVNALANVNSLSVVGNITGGGTANITGNIRGGNANLGNLASANYLSGVLTTAAQPNITSVGTLTALTVGPNSSVVLSGTSGYVKANSIQGLDGTNTIYMYYGNIAGAAGIYGDLTIGTSGTGNLIASNGTAFFGNANTVKIQGGSANYVLSTDGSGNLSWVAQSNGGGGGGSNIANGTSNVSIASVNGNINMAVAGNANLIRVSGNGFFANTDIFNLQARIVQQGGNPNGTPLTSDDGKDRGTILNYYNSTGNFSAQAFMGWDDSNAEIAMASEVTVASDVVSIFAFANVRANNFLGNIIGNISGNITSPGSNTQVLYNDAGTIAGASALTFNNTTNAVNASSTFTAVGTVTGGNLSTSGNLNVTNQANVGNLDSFGFINAVSTITGGNFYSGGSIQTVGNATFGNIQTGGDISVTGNFNSGNLATTGGLSVLGNVSIGSLASNLLYVSSNFANFDVNRVTVGGATNGTYIYPNGYVQLRNLSVYTVGADLGTITTSELSVTANANISSLTVNTTVNSGNVSVTGSVSGNTGNFTGNLTALNANLGNLVNANFFQGDGYLLTNLTIPAGTAIVNGNSNVAVAPNANVTITVAGVANVVTVTSSNVIVDGNISTNNITVTNNVNTGTVANANAVINLYNAANVANAYVTIGTDETPSMLRVNNSNVQVNGLFNVSGNANVSGNFNLSANANVGNLNASRANITGNITTGNASLGNLATANFFSGDGYLLTNLTLGAGTYIENGNSNVVVLANANVNISAEGNANVLVISGNNVTSNKRFIAGNANITTAIIATANITDLNLFNNFNADGNLFANGWANVTGLRVRDVTLPGTGGVSVFEGNSSFERSITVTNYANVGTIYAGYIQSHGSIHANANISANGISAAIQLSGANISGTNLSVTTGNITTVNATTANVSGNLNSGNATLGNLATANFFSGDGYLLTNLTLGAGTFIENGNSNVVVLANANVNISANGAANVLVISESGANISGNGNITGNLSVAGNVSVGNISGGRANFTGNANTANLYVTGTLTATGVANTGVLTVNGNVTAANASLGNAVSANYFIGDGYLLSNLTIPAGTAIINGNSNVLVTYASDVNITSNGVANVLKITSTGTVTTGNAEITGYVKAGSFANGSSNITIANNGDIDMYSNASTVRFKVTDDGANIYGAFTNLGSTTITGNANIANIGVSGLVTVAGNITGGNLNTGGRLSVGGNANVGNLYASGEITAVTTVTGGRLVADGNANVGLTANVNALVVRSGGASITGNLDVAGNVNVTGNLNYQNVVDLVVGDPLIFIGANNTGDIVDLGFVASYNTGNFVHTGLARNYQNEYWTFFDGVDAEPTTVIDWANATYPTVKLGNLVATSNGNFAGNVSANNFIGNVFGNIIGNIGLGTNTQVIFSQNGIGNGSANFTFDYATGQVTVNGNIVGSNIIATANLTSGNANLGNLVSANYLTGTLTTSSQPNITSLGTLTGLDVNGTITAANITANTGVFTGNANGLTNIPGANVSGTVPNATSATNASALLQNTSTATTVYPTFTTSSSNGNSSAVFNTSISANLSNGSITATTFVGNLQGNISTIVNGNSNVNIPSANGNVNISSAGNANVVVVTGTGVNVLGTLNTTGNLVIGTGPGGSITNANSITANFFIGDGGLLTNLSATSANFIANGTSNVRIPSTNGNVNISSAGNANILVVTGTGVNVAGTLNTTGNANIGNIGTSGLITATGNITGNYFIGNGSQLTGIDATAIQNGTANVRTFLNGNVTVSASGNANVLVVTGTGANLSGTLNATGNLTVGAATGGNITGANVITANLFVGVFANGNSNVSIPSANGNVNISAAGNANVFRVTGTGVNVAGTLNATGNITGANIITTGHLESTVATGTAPLIVTSTTQVANLNSATAGTVRTNAQPNITSTGTLTALTVGPNSSVVLSGTSGFVKANSIQGTDGTNTIYMYYGNVSGAAGIYGDLTIGTGGSGNLIANTGRAVFGNIGNVTITGGSNGYVLATDGAGNLNWVAQSGGGGSANIQILDEGNILTNSVSSINFVGAGVVANNTGNAVTVTISGGGGGSAVDGITLDSFTGNGVQTNFTLSVTPQSEIYTSVNIDGVSQLKTDYSLSGNTLILSGAPAAGANIEVTTIAMSSATSAGFVTRTYTGNGVQNTFAVTSGVTNNSILVMENGIVQVPVTDYSVSGANLIFTSPPANSMAIQVRELAGGGSGGGITAQDLLSPFLLMGA